MTRLGPFGTGVLGPEQAKAKIDFPPKINRDFHCRNQVAIAPAVTGLAATIQQHIYAHRRKMLFNFVESVGTLNGFYGAVAASGGAPVGTQNWYQVHIHTGHGCEELVFHHLCAPPLAGSTAANPSIRWHIYDSDGVLVGSTEYFYPPRKEFGGFSDLASLSEVDLRFSVNGDTTYQLALEVNDLVRVLSSCVFESRSPVVVPGAKGCPAHTSAYRLPVCADDYYDLVAHGERLRTKNGTVIHNWTRSFDAASAHVITGATWTNIYDGTTSAGGLGFKYDLTNADSISGRGVGCRLAVRARLSGLQTIDGSLGVRLIRSSDGAELAVVQGFTLPAPVWRTTEFDLTELTGPVELQARGNALFDIELDAVNLYLYEAGDAYADLPSEKSDMFLIDRIDVDVDTDAVSFGAAGDGVLQAALDGDVDGTYIIRGRWNKPSTSVTWLHIQPNGASVSGSADTQSMSRTGTTQGGVAQGNLLGIVNSGAHVDQIDFEVKFDALAVSGEQRTFRTKGGVVRSGALIIFDSFAQWNNGTDKITAPKFLTDVGGDNILAGSYFKLYKLKADF